MTPTAAVPVAPSSGPSESTNTQATRATAADLLPLPAPLPASLEALVDELGDVTLARELRACGRYFQRGYCGCGRRALAITCKKRICPHCERTRAIKAVKKYAPLFEGHEHLRFITLTVRRHELGELRLSIVRMRKWFKKLRAAFPELFYGGVYSIETKGKRAARGERGGWHTHIHVLAFGPRHGFVPRDELLAEWFKITKGRCTMRVGVDVRAARRCERDGWLPALQECLKYVTKGLIREKGGEVDESAVGAWTPEMLREFLAATKHVRLFHKFGKAGKVAKLPACECDECGEVVVPEDASYSCSMTREQAIAWVARGRVLEVIPGRSYEPPC